MKFRAIASVFSILATQGCATTGTAVSAAPTTAAAVVSEPAVASAGVVIVADSIGCMIGYTSEANRCQQLADLAAMSSTALASGNHAAIEQLSEIATNRARADRMPIVNRTILGRWFDLAAGAAREARVARAGAQCTSIEACGARAEGHPAIEDVEAAMRVDSTGVRGNTQLRALFDYVSQAGDLAADVEASAILILNHRVETAAHSRPEVHEEAIQTVAELVSVVRDGHAGAPSGPAPVASAARAHDTAGASAVVLGDARALIADRLAAVETRVTAPSIRAAAQTASSVARTQATPASPR